MHFKTAKDEFSDYLVDASNMKGGDAEKLFVPETAREVSKILVEANERHIPVTVSGARTGTVGGAIPFGGYVISLEKFQKLEIIKTPTGGRAVVGAGVRLKELQDRGAEENLFYAPDPTEWSCQIGGTVATNASGARSFKYGSTRNYVEKLEIVLPDGDFLKLQRGTIFGEKGFVELHTKRGKTIRVKLPTYTPPSVRKNTSGYFSGKRIDAIDLFIGSEGTLGVITEIELRLLPKPAGFLSGIVFFDNEADLLDAVAEIRKVSFEFRSRKQSGNVSLAAGIDATTLEYFDKKSLDFIKEKFPETPSPDGGAIFFEQEMSESNEESLLSIWNDLFEKHSANLKDSWFAVDDNDIERLRIIRHALPVAVNERVAKNGQSKIGTDMAVPDSEMASFLKFYRQSIEASGLDYVIFGHIGDGHLHANMLPKDEREAKTARNLYGRFVAQAIMRGGTVSAEHGIGKLKSKYLYVMYGERYLGEMAELKKAFDSNGILGRGNMFDSKYLA